MNLSNAKAAGYGGVLASEIVHHSPGASEWVDGPNLGGVDPSEKYMAIFSNDNVVDEGAFIRELVECRHRCRECPSEEGKEGEGAEEHGGGHGCNWIDIMFLCVDTLLVYYILSAV